MIAPIIVNYGTISANGGNGGGYKRNPPANDKAGGAGAGGSILFKAQMWVNNATITALAGIGGGNPQVSDYGNGGNGYIALDYVNSYAGATSPPSSNRYDSILASRFFGAIL